MKRLPLRIFVFVVIVGGMAIALSVISRDPFIPQGRQILTALLWLALACLVDVSPMHLPRGGATASVSSVLDFAAILVFGPAAAIQIGLIAIAVTRGFTRRDPWYKLLFNAAQITLAIGVSGLIYTGLGGPVGEELSAEGALLPLLAAACAYFLLNTSLVSVAVGLSEGLGWRRIWQANFQWETNHLFAFLPLGLLVALVLQKIGIWGVMLLFVQLLVIRHMFQLYMELRETNRGIVSILSTVIEASDPYLRNHLQRVSIYSVRVARAMGIPERNVEVIETAALLHDLGKVKVDQEIFKKKTSLSPDEIKKVQGHPKHGAEWIRDFKALDPVRRIIVAHHERPDGMGYPAKLTKDQIPIGARIIGAVDAYDAMTSDRSYRKARTPEAAIAELEKGAGTQFDSDVVTTIKRLFVAGEFLLDEDLPDRMVGNA